MSINQVILDDFVIDTPLEGGMLGPLYRANDPRFGRTIALQTLSNPGESDRFARVCITAARLCNPNIWQVLACGTHKGSPACAFEHVEYTTLKALMNPQAQRFNEDEIVEITRGILSALAHAAERGIAHGALTPAQIHVTRNGRVKVYNFGLAAEVPDPRVLCGGSATYMSPEQSAGQPVSVRSDLYSVGCVLYELMCGEPPFKGADFHAVAYKQMFEKAPLPSSVNPNINPELEKICFKLMMKMPEERYASPVDALRELANIPSRSLAAELSLAARVQGAAGNVSAVDAMMQQALSAATREPAAASSVSAPSQFPSSVPVSPAQVPTQRIAVPQRQPTQRTMISPAPMMPTAGLDAGVTTPAAPIAPAAAAAQAAPTAAFEPIRKTPVPWPGAGQSDPTKPGATGSTSVFPEPKPRQTAAIDPNAAPRQPVPRNTLRYDKPNSRVAGTMIVGASSTPVVDPPSAGRPSEVPPRPTGTAITPGNTRMNFAVGYVARTTTTFGAAAPTTPEVQQPASIQRLAQKLNPVFRKLDDGRWSYSTAFWNCEFAEGLAKLAHCKRDEHAEGQLGDCILCANWSRKLGCVMANNQDIPTSSTLQGPRLIGTMAQAWTSVGQYDKSVKLLEEFIKEFPEDAELHRDLARLYDKPDYPNRDRNKAVQHYRKFADLARKTGELSKFEIQRAEERATALETSPPPPPPSGQPFVPGITFECFYRGAANCYAYGMLGLAGFVLARAGNVDPQTGQLPGAKKTAPSTGATALLKRFIAESPKSNPVAEREEQAGVKKELARLSQLSFDNVVTDMTKVMLMSLSAISSFDFSTEPTTGLRSLVLKGHGQAHQLMFTEGFTYQAEQLNVFMQRYLKK